MKAQRRGGAVVGACAVGRRDRWTSASEGATSPRP